VKEPPAAGALETSALWKYVEVRSTGDLEREQTAFKELHQPDPTFQSTSSCGDFSLGLASTAIFVAKPNIVALTTSLSMPYHCESCCNADDNYTRLQFASSI
jgi:hypothetical protein